MVARRPFLVELLLGRCRDRSFHRGMAMTESERDEAANTLISCIAAVFKQLKSRDPAAYPWVGNMLGTEHIRQLGTSVFIQLNRRGDGSPSNPSFVAPAAH